MFFFSKWLCFVKVPSLYGESCTQDVGCQSETNTLLLCEWTGPKLNTCVSKKYAGELCRSEQDCVNNQICLNVVGGARRCNDVMNIVKHTKTIPTVALFQYGGVLQDFEGGGGAFFIDSTAVELEGNAWKALELSEPFNIISTSQLSFEFNLLEEAEGHAICADDDVDPFPYRGIKRRCVALGGSSIQNWNNDLIVTKYRSNSLNYVIQLTDLFDKDIGSGQQIKYISLIQDNDSQPKKGRSRFSKIKLYDEKNPAAIHAVFYEHDFYGKCERYGQNCGFCVASNIFCLEWLWGTCICTKQESRCLHRKDSFNLKIPVFIFRDAREN